MARNNEVKVTFKAFNKEFNSAISDMNNEAKRLRQEMKLQEEQMKYNGTESQKLEARLNNLQQQYELAQRKTRETAQQLDRVRAQFGENSIEVQRMESALRSAQIAEQQMANKMTETETALNRQKQSFRDLQTLLRITEAELDDFSDALGSELVNDIRNGTANSKQLEEAIARIGREAIGANTDLERLRTALRNADNGANLDQIRQDFNQISQEADEAGQSVNEFGSELSGVVAGLAAGGGIAGAVEKALDTSSLNTKIDITFDVPEKSKMAVKEAINQVNAYGVDAEEALEGVRRQWALNADASDDANTKIVKGAGAIASAFSQIDFIELVQETNELAASIFVSNEEALALVDSLLKAGFPPEQLDTISEYGLQMADAGFSAKEIQAIFEAGIDTKTWNIDNLNDGVKEARLQMASFGLEVDDNLGELIQKTGITKKQFQDWGKAVAGGGDKGSKAMSEVATWLDGIEDKTLKNELATKVFGTKWEDQGANMIAVFNGVDGAIDKTNENAKGIDETVSKMDADPVNQLRKAFGDLKLALEPMLSIIADLVGKFAEWISENPKLVATITAIMSALGILLGIVMALAPIFTAITTAASAMGVGIGAIAWPVGIVIAAIAALIAIGVLVWQNWDTIRAKATEIWSAIQEKIGVVIQEISTYIQEKFGQVVTWWKENQDSILQAAQNVWTVIQKIISITMTVIQSIMSVVWPIIKSLIVGTWDAIKNVINGALNFIMGIIKTFSSLFTGDWKGLWEGIKQLAGGALEALWGLLQLGFIGRIFKIIKGFAGKAVDAFMDMVGKSKAWFDDLLGAAKSKFNEIKEKITSPIQKAKDKVGEIVDGIKNFFSNMKLEIPKIKLPKLPRFSIEGKFSLNPLSVPKLKVDWHAKGAVFTKPTLFGVSGGRLQGAGEAGPEAVLPLNDTVLGKIGAMIAKTMKAPEAPTVYIARTESFNGVDNFTRSQMEKQPAVINLQLGTQNFNAFVDDINRVNELKTMRKTRVRGRW